MPCQKIYFVGVFPPTGYVGLSQKLPVLLACKSALILLSLMTKLTLSGASLCQLSCLTEVAFYFMVFKAVHRLVYMAATVRAICKNEIMEEH